MSGRYLRAWLGGMLLVVALGVLSCSRRNASGEVRRIAITPASVLLGDGGSQWIGLATSFVLQQDLASSTRWMPVFATDESAAYLAGASDLLATTVERRNGQIHIDAALFDLRAQRKRFTYEADGARSEDLVAALDHLAVQMDGDGAHHFSTASTEALRQFTLAALTPDPANRVAQLRGAINSDKNFGLAYVALAEILGSSALDGVDPGRFAPVDRARWDALTSKLRNLPAADQVRALRQLLTVTPYDASVYTSLGTLYFAQGNRTEGDHMLRRAADLSPQNAGVIRAQLAKFQGSSGTSSKRP